LVTSVLALAGVMAGPSDLRDRRHLRRPRLILILSQMANYQSAARLSHLPDVFYALGDPTRLAIVGQLGRGPASVTALAAPFAMALPSFMKHLSVLERSGVIRSEKIGRVRTCQLVPKALVQAQGWLAEQRAVWDARSDRMSAFVETLHQEDLSREQPQRKA
jgi:DNA-binding transcriptional ArsR family regulator